MEEPVRKVSLIQFAYMTWSECSGTHKGVRKRTAAASNLKRLEAGDPKNPMKLQWYAPLAMRMLIPWALTNRVALPHFKVKLSRTNEVRENKSGTDEPKLNSEL
jgi:hypothetical protein